MTNYTTSLFQIFVGMKHSNLIDFMCPITLHQIFVGMKHSLSPDFLCTTILFQVRGYAFVLTRLFLSQLRTEGEMHNLKWLRKPPEDLFGKMYMLPMNTMNLETGHKSLQDRQDQELT